MVKFPSINLPGQSKRPAYTLLFITEVKTFRVDVDKAGVLFGNAEVIVAACPSTFKLAECISTIAANSRPFGRKVWLLYVVLPIALLSLPSMQVEGVDEETLLQALQFELEGLTGQSSLDMQLAYHLLSNKDEMSSYWVSQINQMHFNDLYKAVQKAGSSLAGLLHPAALPFSLENPERQDWLRLECWSKQLAAIRCHPEDGLTMGLFSFDGSHSWQANRDLTRWLDRQGDVPHSETLLNNKIEVLPETSFYLHLNDVEPVTDWLLGWAGVLVKKTPPACPILRYQSKLNKDLLLMASGGSIALLLCLGHSSWHLYHANQFAAKAAALQKVEASITSMNKGLSSAQAKRDQMKGKIDKLKGDSQTLPRLVKGLQQRPARLLEALAEGRPENLLVEGIAVDKDEIKITGLSLDATSPNELSNYLDKQLPAQGWSVIAPTKKNMELFVDGGPWEFEIKLLDLGVDGFSKKQ